MHWPRGLESTGQAFSAAQVDSINGRALGDNNSAITVRAD